MKSLLLLIPVLLMVGCAAQPTQTASAQTSIAAADVRFETILGVAQKGYDATKGVLHEWFGQIITESTAGKQNLAIASKQSADQERTVEASQSKFTDRLMWASIFAVGASIIFFALWGYSHIAVMEKIGIYCGIAAIAFAVLDIFVDWVHQHENLIFGSFITIGIGSLVYVLATRSGMLTNLLAAFQKAKAKLAPAEQAVVAETLKIEQTPAVKTLVAKVKDTTGFDAEMSAPPPAPLQT